MTFMVSSPVRMPPLAAMDRFKPPTRVRTMPSKISPTESIGVSSQRRVQCIRSMLTSQRGSEKTDHSICTASWSLRAIDAMLVNRLAQLDGDRIAIIDRSLAMHLQNRVSTASADSSERRCLFANSVRGHRLRNPVIAWRIEANFLPSNH